MEPLYIILTLVLMGLSRLVSAQMQRRFAQFSQMPLPYTGRDVAEMMLRDAKIGDVDVTHVQGHLTDHYNPSKKSVNLSEVVYSANNVAAAAVAAHECGHAVQHRDSYPFLKLRSSLVPIVQLSSSVMQWVLLAGLMLAAASRSTTVLLIGIIMFATTTLFAFVTLPVEFNASSRALKWMHQRGVTTGAYHEHAKKALFWAAMTYTVAAIGSLGQLIYWIMLYLRSSRR